MFGKVMSIPDKAMPSYARLVTRWKVEKIEDFEMKVRKDEMHPRDAKMALAEEITAAFFDEEKADKARQHFISLFQKRDTPEDMPEFSPKGDPVLLEVLVDSGLVKSKSQARRLIQQNGVKIDGETASDPYDVLSPPVTVQVGKRRFVKVVN
jgi:tyrosyl-tRNA synthetase